MAVQTLPVQLDLVIYGGTTFRREFRWIPDGTTPQDFTGWTALMLIGPSRGHALLELSTGAGITLDDEGLITVTISAAATDALPDVGLVYQLDLINPDLEVTRFLRGHVSVYTDVERAS